MKTKEYLKTIVAPTIDEYRSDPASQRRFFLACLVTFHATDYLARETKKSKTAVRNELKKQSKDFLLIDRLAHAFKHTKSGDDNSTETPKLEASEVISRPPAIIGQMVLGLSRLGDTVGGIEIYSKRNAEANNRADLLPVLERAYIFLVKKANDMKLN